VTAALLAILLLAGGGIAYLLDAQAREQLRMERIAGRITNEYTEEAARRQKGAAIFSALPRDWPYARLGDGARETLGGIIRGAALTRLRFPGGAIPIVLEPWRDGAAAGLSDGSLHLVTDWARPLLARPACSESDIGLMRCAITALDGSGERLVAGTNRGEVIIFDSAGRAPATRAAPSALRIEAVLAMGAGHALAADASGSLYDVGAGSLRTISEGGGSVVKLLREPQGSLLIVRSAGEVQRLAPDGRLTTVARYPGPVRSAGLMNGQFYLMRMAIGSTSGRGLLLEGRPEDATPRQDADTVYVEDTREGVFFGLAGGRIVYGRNLDIRLFDPAARQATNLGIEGEAYERESRDVAFGLYGTIAASRDGRWLYSVDQGSQQLLVIDLTELARINALLASRTLRRDLCAPDMERVFQTLGIPRSACD
jgi:hypothetical protein